MWEDNIKVELMDINCEDMNWTALAHEVACWRLLVKTFVS
jgi:hypothetical protein